MTVFPKPISTNVDLLKSKATRQSVYGVVIASSAVIIATFLYGYFQFDSLSLSSFMLAQQNNKILWLLDSMPFIFAFWGQYVSTIMAYEAGIMVEAQTSELREQTVVLEKKMLYEATHDVLTDLPNRFLMHDRLQQAILSAQRENKSLAILLLDLDNFKEINDTLGHSTGDELLKQVGVRLRGNLRQADSLARLGGDEFCMLLSTIKSTEDVHTVARKIHENLEAPFMLAGLKLDVRAGIGASVYPDHGKDADTLIQRADVAMYVAKDEKRDFVLYDPSLDLHSPRRLTLMGELRHAIDNNDLVLYYQPKVSTRRNRVVAVEALVRWIHKQHGLMMPDDFIHLAERTGLIKNLSNWVLNEALAQISRWQESGFILSVSVNISSQDLLDPDLPQRVEALLAEYAVPPERLVLEITETSIMTDHHMALQVLTSLAEAGVMCSIDDFGTGYSSLSYLKKLPAKEMKIDKSFVLDMIEDENDSVIVQATIGMAHSLGMKVVAEGVESREVAESLSSLGCDTLQGFYISRPMEGDKFIDWLQKSEWECDEV